jgi:branched-chain amino acid transport system permease protein
MLDAILAPLQVFSFIRRVPTWLRLLQDTLDRPQYRWIRWVLLAAILVVVILFPSFEDQNQVNAATEAEVFVLLAMGLNIVVGYAGLLDLGYAAVFAIGGLAMGWPPRTSP